MFKIVYAVYNRDVEFRWSFIRRCQHILFMADGTDETAVFFKFDENKNEKKLYLDEYLKCLCEEKPVRVTGLKELY